MTDLDDRVRPVTRAAAVLLVMGTLAGFVLVLVIGEMPRPDWSEATGLLFVLPTLTHVAVTGRTPPWIRVLKASRKQ